MKKRAIAVLLSIVLTVGNAGAVPVFAAETSTAQEAVEVSEEVAAEEESGEELVVTEQTAEKQAEEEQIEEEQNEVIEQSEDTDSEVSTEDASVENEDENVDSLDEVVSEDETVYENEEEATNESEEAVVEDASVVKQQVAEDNIVKNEAESGTVEESASLNKVETAASEAKYSSALSAEKANGQTTIEVIGGRYYWYTYATTYGNLSFNVSSDTYCSVIQGRTTSNAGYYYYSLNFYPKDGGNNTIIEVFDNDSGKNIDLLIVHSSYQETDPQTICNGKNLVVSFETTEEISASNVLVGSMGTEDSISCVLNSLNLESVLSHGSDVPYTYEYSANLTLYTSGSYSVVLMNNSTYTTLVKIPVTVQGHDYDNGVITSEATCQRRAILTKTCNNCGNIIREEVGDFADHIWSNQYTIDKEPTCIEEGAESIHCSVCGVIDETTIRAISKKNHIYGDWTVTKEATCTEEGSESIYCSVCGAIDETTVRTIPKKDHEYGDWTITKEATCIEEGSKERVCAGCGDKVTEAIPATGHLWNEEYTVDKAATCTEEGSESIHCSVCDVIDETTVRKIDKKDHAYGDWIVTKEATCTEDGSKEKVCADCGDKVTETILSIGHVWNVEYTVDKDATCTEEGSESIHCSVCNVIDESTVRAIPKKEHAYSDWAITKEATCTEDGIQEQVCVECGDKITEVIPAGHIWDTEYTEDIEPSCIQEGSESIHCKVCGEIDEATIREIPKREHVFGDWEKICEATCTAEGIQEARCISCGEIISETIPAIAHIWGDYTVDKEPTCTEEGSESIHCSVCDTIDEISVRSIPKKEHVYGDWTVTKEATCTEAGSKEKICAECGDKVAEEIAAAGHKWDEDYTVDKAATCTEEGSESIHCSVCGKMDETTVRAIPKKEHAYGSWTITKTVTCTEAGSIEKVCADCSNKITEEIQATGHKWNEEYTVDKSATCTEQGSESIHCSVCGEIDETTVRAIPKKEHTYGDWTVTKAAICTVAGSREKVCTDCSDKVTEEIPATGHKWNEKYTTDKAPTYTQTGTESIHCSVCGAIKDGSARTIAKLPKPVTMLTVSGLAAKAYNGAAQTQTLVVKDGTVTLKAGTDYTVSYSNNINAGTASLTITGKGNYTGSVSKTFAINKIANKITAKNFTKTYSTKAQSFALGVKVSNGVPTYKSNTKYVTVSKAGKVTVKAKYVGKATITITAPNTTNYSSTTKKITITVKPSKAALSSVSSPSAGKMTVKWKKNTSGKGYQIQYSTSSKFSSSKKVTISKNTQVSKTIGSLSKGKKYYVRIRTFKKVGSSTLYSGWSSAKAVKIKK